MRPLKARVAALSRSGPVGAGAERQLVAVPVDRDVPAAAGAVVAAAVVHQLLLGAAQRAEARVAAPHGKGGALHELPEAQIRLPGEH